jgi:hypothetical protein
MQRKLIGSVCVDSGQLMVVDPCYLHEWTDDAFRPRDDERDTEPTGTFSYDGACRATCSPLGHGLLDVRPHLDNRHDGVIGMAAVSTTEYGDGVYPVYADFRDGETRPFRLIVEFSEEDEAGF